MRSSRTLRKRGGDFFKPSWLFGQKQQPSKPNWSTATVNPIKKALNSYPLKRTNGTRHLIPIRHQAYGGPGILTKRNNSTQKAQKPKKTIAFNPKLYVGNFNGPTLPRAVNSRNFRRHFNGRKNEYSNAYKNVPNETLWSTPNNWARSENETREGINNPPFVNGPEYSRKLRNYYAHYATSKLYPRNTPEQISELSQFTRKNNSRRKMLENTTRILLERNRQIEEQAQQQAQQDLNPDILWSD